MDFVVKANDASEAQKKWDARGERSDVESGDTQPADARSLQRRSTNIKSEHGSEEIDLKTFYYPFVTPR